MAVGGSEGRTILVLCGPATTGRRAGGGEAPRRLGPPRRVNCCAPATRRPVWLGRGRRGMASRERRGTRTCSRSMLLLSEASLVLDAAPGDRTQGRSRRGRTRRDARPAAGGRSAPARPYVIALDLPNRRRGLGRRRPRERGCRPHDQLRSLEDRPLAAAGPRARRSRAPRRHRDPARRLRRSSVRTARVPVGQGDDAAAPRRRPQGELRHCRRGGGLAPLPRRRALAAERRALRRRPRRPVAAPHNSSRCSCPPPRRGARPFVPQQAPRAGELDGRAARALLRALGSGAAACERAAVGPGIERVGAPAPLRAIPARGLDAALPPQLRAWSSDADALSIALPAPGLGRTVRACLACSRLTPRDGSPRGCSVAECSGRLRGARCRAPDRQHRRAEGGLHGRRGATTRPHLRSGDPMLATAGTRRRARRLVAELLRPGHGSFDPHRPPPYIPRGLRTRVVIARRGRGGWHRTGCARCRRSAPSWRGARGGTLRNRRRARALGDRLRGAERRQPPGASGRLARPGTQAAHAQHGRAP